MDRLALLTDDVNLDEVSRPILEFYVLEYVEYLQELMEEEGISITEDITFGELDEELNAMLTEGEITEESATELAEVWGKIKKLAQKLATKIKGKKPEKKSEPESLVGKSFTIHRTPGKSIGQVSFEWIE